MKNFITKKRLSQPKEDQKKAFFIKPKCEKKKKKIHIQLRKRGTEKQTDESLIVLNGFPMNIRRDRDWRIQ